MPYELAVLANAPLGPRDLAALLGGAHDAGLAVQTIEDGQSVAVVTNGGEFVFGFGRPVRLESYEELSRIVPDVDEATILLPTFWHDGWIGSGHAELGERFAGRLALGASAVLLPLADKAEPITNDDTDSRIAPDWSPTADAWVPVETQSAGAEQGPGTAAVDRPPADAGEPDSDS